jgi:hypothetical protein
MTARTINASDTSRRPTNTLPVIVCTSAKSGSEKRKKSTGQSGLPLREASQNKTTNRVIEKTWSPRLKVKRFQTQSAKIVPRRKRTNEGWNPDVSK